MKIKKYVLAVFCGVLYVFGGCSSSARTGNPVPSSDFAKIEGGTFMMGSPETESGRLEDEILHKVTVRGFYIGKYEIRVEEFRQFAEETGYQTVAEYTGGGSAFNGITWETKEDASWKNPYISQEDNHPAVLINWYDAVNYCNWRSEKEGLKPAYTVRGSNITWDKKASGYRLPTEAEWEYACRAGAETPYYSGESPDNAGWYHGNSGDGTHPVGEKTPNEWGLFDMHGNVWEWCWDRYGEYASNPQTNPDGGSSGHARVLRGGGWRNDAQSARSAHRLYLSPISGSNFLGFRLARNL